MEDTPDKVRRNLVAFSTAILISSFLQLDIKTIPVLSIDVSGIDPGKVWTVILCVVFYLMLRFHFLPDTQKSLSEATLAFKSAYQAAMIGRTKSVIAAASAKNWKDGQIFDVTLEENDLLKTNGGLTDVAAKRCRGLTFAGFTPLNSIRGKFAAKFKFDWEHDAEGNPYFMQHELQINGTAGPFLRILSLHDLVVRTGKVSLYTKHTFDCIAPYAISLIALFVIAYKLSAALQLSFDFWKF